MLHSMEETIIKNRPYYFVIEIINIQNFDPSPFEINKLSFKSPNININIYHIEYITMKSLDHVNIDSGNKVMEINTWFLLLQTRRKKY